MDDVSEAKATSGQLSTKRHLSVRLKSPSGSHVIDATGMIAGRLSSKVARMLIEGKHVVIVNGSKALLSGKRNMVISEYLESLKVSSVVHPKHGPFHPRTPSGIISRMIRGMIPRRKPKGRLALKRLHVYSGIPENFSKAKFESFDECKATKPIAFYVSIGEVASRIGWKG